MASALAASQDADEVYYALDAAGRARRAAPYVDRTLLVDRAAAMIDALVSAARDLGDPALLAPAKKAATALLGMRDVDGRFFHARRPGAPAEVRGLLGDQARAARALFDLARALPPAEGELFRSAANAALDATLRTLAAPEGGYYDRDAGDAPGLLQRRERPLVDNAILARALLAAGRRAEAERTLAAFAGAYLFYGTEAAEYALAVEEFLASGK
jgi:uncharacterized protein YyaL (SSP411 family)